MIIGLFWLYLFKGARKSVTFNVLGNLANGEL